jgi:hypothetical protein
VSKPDRDESPRESLRAYVEGVLAQFEARWPTDAPGDDLTIDVLESLDEAMFFIERGDLDTARWYVSYADELAAEIKGLDRGHSEARAAGVHQSAAGGRARARKRTNAARRFRAKVDAARGPSIRAKLRNVLAKKHRDWHQLDQDDQKRLLNAAERRYYPRRPKRS